MIKINKFNSDLYYLGKICKYGHAFFDTRQSLRQKSNRTCIECQKAIRLKHVLLNFDLCAKRMRHWREQISVRENIVIPAEKNCSVCHLRKTADSFYPDKCSIDGLLSHCTACDKIRQSIRRAKHQKPKVYKDPETIKANRRKIKSRYKKTAKGKLANSIAHHRRKALKLKIGSVKYTPTELQSRFAEFGNKCVYCGDDAKISLDHFKPVSKLGADALTNIVPACIKCNSSKNNKDPELWFKGQTFFTEEKWKNLIEKIEM